MASSDDRHWMRARILEVSGCVCSRLRFLCAIWIIDFFPFPQTSFGWTNLHFGHNRSGKRNFYRCASSTFKIFFKVTAFVVIPITMNRGILIGVLLGGGLIFFFVISKLGDKLLAAYEARLEKRQRSSDTLDSTCVN